MPRPKSSASTPDPVPTAPEALLTPEAAADLGGCTPRVLREMARDGHVPSYRLGTGPRARLRFKWSEVEAALRTRGASA
jgi:excisionase family DNA binding protein